MSYRVGSQIQVDDAVRVLRESAESLRSNPAQFSFRVMQVGNYVQAEGGGTGQFIQVTGGGPGSSTIGLQASGTSSSHIEVSQDPLGREVRANEWANTLDLIADHLATESKPDRRFVQRQLDGLREQALPNVVMNLISSVIWMTLGLAG